MIGYPLLPYQEQALTLSTKVTVLVAPRQTGKSYSLAVLSLWWAFRKPKQRVLLVSAGEEASKRLLSQVASIATHDLLKGSVLNETTGLLLLSNSSEIRSVPASERQIRGWSVDLLIVDEGAYVSDEVFLGAALPTTVARPDSRIVVASTPWSQDGAFYRYAVVGREGDETTRTFTWGRKDAPWIDEAQVEMARKTLPALRFAAEYEGEFVGASDALFPPHLLRDATCPYPLLAPHDARSEEVVVGVDWGRAFDRHAVVCVGVLEDFGVNKRPILYVPYMETSVRPYTEMVEAVVALAHKSLRRRSRRISDFYAERPLVERFANGHTLHESGLTVLTPEEILAGQRGYAARAVVTETNGVGQMPSEVLKRRIGNRVVQVHSSQRSKEDAYGRLKALLLDRRIVLPDDLELIRQLQGMTYVPTRQGGLSIAAADESVHDDLADALSLCVAAIPTDASAGVPADAPADIEWTETAGGVRVPIPPRPRKSALRRYARAWSG